MGGQETSVDFGKERILKKPSLEDTLESGVNTLADLLGAKPKAKTKQTTRETTTEATTETTTESSTKISTTEVPTLDVSGFTTTMAGDDPKAAASFGFNNLSDPTQAGWLGMGIWSQTR